MCDVMFEHGVPAFMRACPRDTRARLGALMACVLASKGCVLACASASVLGVVPSPPCVMCMSYEYNVDIS